MANNKVGLGINNMPGDIRRNYFGEALKILFKFSKPSVNDVYYHLCRGDHCPTKHCSYMHGWEKGRSCHHVLNTKELIDKILGVIDLS
jgi:hypothetical protein